MATVSTSLPLRGLWLWDSPSCCIVVSVFWVVVSLLLALDFLFSKAYLCPKLFDDEIVSQIIRLDALVG
jgi:hypothetical protein